MQDKRADSGREAKTTIWNAATLLAMTRRRGLAWRLRNGRPDVSPASGLLPNERAWLQVRAHADWVVRMLVAECESLRAFGAEVAEAVVAEGWTSRFADEWLRRWDPRTDDRLAHGAVREGAAAVAAKERAECEAGGCSPEMVARFMAAALLDWAADELKARGAGQ